MEFVLIPILLAYPVSACFGGLGGCCQPSQQGCAGPLCSGAPVGRGGYVAPSYPGGVDYRGGSYASPANSPSLSSYNAFQAAPAISSYNAPQAAPPPSYGAPRAPSLQQYAGSVTYEGSLKAPPAQSYSGASVSQTQYRDSSLGGAQSPLLPPENPPVPGRFAEGVEQATLPDGGTIDIGGISSGSSSIAQTIDQEVVQQQASTISPGQAVPIAPKNSKLRHWRI
uniref:Uncharacterized protein n=1 Tax=Elaeophora elaphi TaxID=1147741 RepID=A0A0R3S0R6_9BILA